jgi:hypothetical protein
MYQRTMLSFAVCLSLDILQKLAVIVASRAAGFQLQEGRMLALHQLEV